MSEDQLMRMRHREVAAIHALMACEPVLDHPQIARYGGFAPGTAKRAIEYLKMLGVVCTSGPEALGWRRPPGQGTNPQSVCCLTNNWGYAIGVSAGYHGVGTGLVDVRGRFREHRTTAEHATDEDARAQQCLVDEALAVSDDYWQTLQTIAGQIYECVKRRRGQLNELGDTTAVDVRAITVGLPGQITGIRAPDPAQRRVLTLERFSGQPIATDLATMLAQRYAHLLEFDPRAIPIWIENDADCAAVGELHCGKGVDCRSLLVVEVSSGIGAGIILDGTLHYGHEATAGEIGHDPVHPALLSELNDDLPDGLPPLQPGSELLQCSCASADAGHLEAYASTTATMCRVLGKSKVDIDLRGRREALRAIIRAAIVDGDRKARHAIENAGSLVGRKINTLAAALGPERVLVIGPLSEAEALFLGPIHDQIELLRAPITHAPIDVTIGTRWPAARWIGVKGAARLALERGVWGPRTFGTDFWPGYQAADALIRSERQRRG